MRNLILFICITAILVSCDVYPQDDYEEYYVVESYLVADRQLPHIRISTTTPANVEYNFNDVAVNNALVEVHLLETGPESAIEESYSFTLNQPGIYLPEDAHRVLPSRTYELQVTFPDSEEEITAHTIIPGDFEILDAGNVQDTIVYQSSEQLEVDISESSYPGRQNIFVFNSIAQNPTADSLTPVYRDFYEDNDEDPDDLINFANNSSGIINEANLEKNRDSSNTIDLPWISIAFYGDTKIVANTIDDNVYDFVRSQQVQLGGSTLSPGEIQNVIYHVKGGIGVFGGLATDTISTHIKRNPAIN